MLLPIDVPVGGTQIAIKMPAFAAAEIAVREKGALLAPDRPLFRKQAPCLGPRQLARAHALNDPVVLLPLHPVDTRRWRGVPPVIAKPRVNAVAAESVIRTGTPKAAVVPVTPECMAAAAVIEAIATSPMTMAVLTVVALAEDMARLAVEIAVQVPALSRIEAPIGAEPSLLALHLARSALQAARLTPSEIALPQSLMDALLLPILPGVNAALAFCSGGRQSDRAGEKCCQQCTACNALHVFLLLALVPVPRWPCSADASGGAGLRRLLAHVGQCM